MRRIRTSLAAKALGLQLAGLLAIAGIVGAIRYYAIRAELYREVQASARSVEQVVEDFLAEHPEFLRRESLDPIVDRFARRLPAVARVSVVEPTGVIIADSREPEGGQTDQPDLRAVLSEPGERRHSFTAGGSRYLRVSRSLRGRYDPARRSDIAGAISLDMRLALIDAAITRELVAEMTVVLLLLVPIGGLLYLWTRRTFVRPLEQLAAAGAQFARGEVPAPLAFPGHDELSGVALTFNEMVEARTRAFTRTEEMLTASEERYRRLFDENPQPAWVFDRDTFAILAANEAAARQYGYSRDELLSLTVRDIRPPEDIAAFEQYLASRAPGPSAAATVVRHRRKDGSVFEAEVASNDIAFNGRRAILAMAVDVTARRRAEERQRTLLRELTAALADVKVLRGILPICAQCKRVRTDQGSWDQIESYVRDHTDAEFSHGLCPDCAKAWGA